MRSCGWLYAHSVLLSEQVIKPGFYSHNCNAYGILNAKRYMYNTVKGIMY